MTMWEGRRGAVVTQSIGMVVVCACPGLLLPDMVGDGRYQCARALDRQ
jgi:hypothetical protein